MSLHLGCWLEFVPFFHSFLFHAFFPTFHVSRILFVIFIKFVYCIMFSSYSHWPCARKLIAILKIKLHFAMRLKAIKFKITLWNSDTNCLRLLLAYVFNRLSNMRIVFAIFRHPTKCFDILQRFKCHIRTVKMKCLWLQLTF